MSEQTIDANEEQSTAVVNWEEKLAGYAQEAAKDEAIAGTWLSVKAGRLAIDKTPVAGNTLDCIVIANAYENAWYEGKFDPIILSLRVATPSTWQRTLWRRMKKQQSRKLRPAQSAQKTSGVLQQRAKARPARIFAVLRCSRKTPWLTLKKSRPPK